MSERKQKVETYRVEYLCDVCGEPMLPSGYSLMSSPPRYQHKCKNEHEKTFSNIYPCIRYENAEPCGLLTPGFESTGLEPGSTVLIKMHVVGK